MRNPLTTLDELIWQQFEKVTVAAEKRLGWDKWDLAEVTSKTGLALFVGYGAYHVILGITGDSIPFTALGTIYLLFGGAGYGVVQANRRSDQEQEEKFLINTRTAPPPQFNPWRPSVLGSSFLLFFQAADYLLKGTEKVPSFLSSLNTEEYNNLSGLLAISIGAASFFMISSSYFKSQLPRPPPAKKSLWEAITGYITNHFNKKIPAPVEAPAEQYGIVTATPPTISH